MSGVKAVYVDAGGCDVEVYLTLDKSDVRITVEDCHIVLPPSELTTFRDFINDELDRIEKELGDAEQAEADDLIESLHPDLREVARRLAAGDTLEQVVRDETFDAQGRRRIPREVIDERVDELRTMLASELAWIFK